MIGGGNLKMFDNYCYGPVDIISIRRGNNTMWLQLLDTTGRKAQAIYRGCVYWFLGRKEKDLHIPLVIKISASELLSRTSSVILTELHRNSDNIESLIKNWENEGLNFYLHFGPDKGSEFLVVAKSLDYHDLS